MANFKIAVLLLYALGNKLSFPLLGLQSLSLVETVINSLLYSSFAFLYFRLKFSLDLHLAFFLLEENVQIMWS